MIPRRLFRQRQLPGNGIDGVYNIIEFFKGKGIRVFWKKKGPVHSHLRLRVNIQDPFLRRVHLIHPKGASCRDDLSVQIGYAHPVAVHKIQGADPASGQSLHGVSADAADAEHGDSGRRKPLHILPSQKPLRSGKLLFSHLLIIHFASLPQSFLWSIAIKTSSTKR